MSNCMDRALLMARQDLLRVEVAGVRHAGRLLSDVWARGEAERVVRESAGARLWAVTPLESEEV